MTLTTIETKIALHQRMEQYSAILYHPYLPLPFPSYVGTLPKNPTSVLALLNE